MSEGGTRTRILSEGGSRSRTCSESSDLGDATGMLVILKMYFIFNRKFFISWSFFVKSEKGIQSLKVIWTPNTSCLCSRPCQDNWDQLWFGREIQLHQGDISVHNITTIWLSYFRSWSLVSSANPWQVPLTLDYLIQQTFFHIRLLKYVLRCWRQW